MKEKGKRAVRLGLSGVGTGEGTGKSMHMCLSKLPFSKLSFSFHRRKIHPKKSTPPKKMFI